MNELLTEGALTKAGNATFVGQFENSCMKHKCNLKPDASDEFDPRGKVYIDLMNAY